MNNLSITSEDKLKKFLRTHQTKDNANITHLSIGDKTKSIYGGKYNIPDNKNEEFYKLYFQAIDNGMPLYLVEKQNIDTGGLGIDLDFRYDKSVINRVVKEQQLTALLEHVIGILNEMFDISEPVENMKGMCVYIALKDDPIITDSLTKDGIHIYVPMVLDKFQRKIFYNRLLSVLPQLFKDDGNINSFEDILDHRVIEGGTGWQLLGSKKPNNIPYKIIKLYKLNIDDDEFDYDEINLKKSVKKYRENMLIRNTTNYKFHLKEHMMEEYNEYKNQQVKKMTNKKNKVVSAYIHNKLLLGDILAIENKEQLDKYISEYVETMIQMNEFNMKIIHDYTMLLNKQFYDPYDKWLMIGHALHYASNTLFPTWVAFSAKSDKFDYLNIEDMIGRWQNMAHSNGDGNSVTEKTIFYYAKQCNPDMYETIKNNSVVYLVNTSVPKSTPYSDSSKTPTNENDVAAVVHAVYRDEYVCSSASKSIWYNFNGMRFNHIEGAIELKKTFSDKIHLLYNSEMQKLVHHMADQQTTDEAENTQIKQRILKFIQVSNQLKQKQFKGRLLEECKEYFHNQDFESQLDCNIDLLGVNNGVIDFKNKCFRKGAPDDYISFTTGISYFPLDKQNKEQMKIVKEIETFFDQILPIKEVQEYVLDYLASCLTGSTKNQTFTIFLGSGANGKSVLMDLMSKTLGDYKYKVPLALLTKDRVAIGGPTSEIAQLKGRRLGVLDEPKAGVKLNEGIMKELTGGDPIAGRHLFKDQIVFVPQFKLAVTTNILPKIDSNDGGTWRRIKVVDFPSKFLSKEEWNSEENGYVKQINPKKYQFLKDDNLKDKFPHWVPVFLTMLVERAYKTGGRVKECQAVMERSNVYRNQMDLLNLFITTRIVKNPASKKITKATVKRAFDEWWQNEADGDRMKPSSNEIYETVEKRIGKYNKGWKGYAIKYDSDSESDSDDD
jgi:P4 family phage/plasmid primase-like protien